MKRFLSVFLLLPFLFGFTATYPNTATPELDIYPMSPPISGGVGGGGGGGGVGPAGPAGPAGATGPAGANGVGVPTGGTAGQVLAKINSTDFNTTWVTPTAYQPLDSDLTFLAGLNSTDLLTGKVHYDAD